VDASVLPRPAVECACTQKAQAHEGERDPMNSVSMTAAGSHSMGLFSSKKFCKIFQIPRHIKSLDTCMKH
jgi:hypothetical protein